MKTLYIVVVVAVLLAVRVAIYRRRKRRRAHEQLADGTPTASSNVRSGTAGIGHRARGAFEGALGDVGTIAFREISERVRGRIFRIGTLVMLLAIGAAIVIPTIHNGTSGGRTRQTVGVVGPLSSASRYLVDEAAARNNDAVRLRAEPSLAAAKADLRRVAIDFAIVNGEEVLLKEPATVSSSPADPSLVDDVAEYLGVVRAYESAHLTPAQASAVSGSRPVPVRTLESGTTKAVKASSLIGLVLLFFMLTQYCSWILIGVMQEKSSRVVEVLLATVRPLELLGGKVLGIGLVALTQAALIVAFALGVGDAVGSDLLRGAETIALLSELFWLVLGYAFYCWLYAAAGSMAERQDQVQTLALPLSIPILLGYIFSITVASTGTPDLFFKILAYVPATAPFCMSVLVGLGDVSWWQFAASALITAGSTVAMASLAARIYRRAVLRTGGRVKLRELFARGAV